MMQLRALLVLLCALLAGPVAAQVPLLLRAGDQSRMSRLVVDLPPGTSWSTAQDGRTVTVRFPGVALDFDTRAIFPDRRASRVLSAQVRNEVTGTILMLTLACDCTAESFALGPRKLIIDVRDRTSPKADAGLPAAPEGSVEGEVTATAPGTGTAPSAASPATPRGEVAGASPRRDGGGEAPPDSTASQGPALSATPPPDPASALARPAEQPVSRPEPMAPPRNDPPLNSEDLAAIEAARSRLMEKLARAAEQGLVDFRAPEAGDTPPEAAAKAPPPETETALQKEDSPPENGPAASQDAAVALEEEPQITISTARDRDQAADTNPDLPPPAYCLPDEALDLASWAGEEPVAAQLAKAREALLGEFDKPDPEAVSKLVRLYIHYGFGREAIDLLDHLGAQVPRDSLLRDLALVVEGEPPQPGGPLSLQAGCPGRAGLWGFFAAIDPQTGAVPRGTPAPDTATLRDLFSEFPAVPRRLLGPRLALGLLDLGREADAGLILSLTAIFPGDPGDAYHYARAKLAEAQGAPAEAERLYRGLIDENRPNAAQAMIALTESRLQRGLPPPGTMAEDLADRALLARRTEQGRRLEAAEIEARAASGELGRALGLISSDLEEDPDRRDELQAAAARIIAAARAPEADPAAYASGLLAHRQLLSEAPQADPARLIAAGELTRIGLPNAALDILAPTLSRGSPEARMAAARAHDLLGESGATLGLLEGMAGPEAARLRAGALAREQDYPAARAALAETRDTGGDARLAFASGDWSGALAAPDPVARVMAAYMAGLGPGSVPLPDPAPDSASPPLSSFLNTPQPEAAISLSGARRALDLARDARTLLNNALDLPPPAPAPGG